MAWIKMRSELLTHPKVVRILSAIRPHEDRTDVQNRSDKFRVIGGLHAVWSIFDQHSEDGMLVGYTPDMMDDMIGWKGFSEAMILVDWLHFDGEQTLVLPDFDAHNSQSAKRRAEDQKRKKLGRKSDKRPQSVRNLSANDPDETRTGSGLEKEKEKEKESKPIGKSIVSDSNSRERDDDFCPKDAAEWLSHFKRNHGFEADPTNVNDRKKLWPVFAAWTKAGLTAGFVDAAVKAAHERSREPIACLPLYVDRLMASDQAARASPTKSFQDRNAETIAALTGRDRDHEPDNRTVDV